MKTTQKILILVVVGIATIAVRTISGYSKSKSKDVSNEDKSGFTLEQMQDKFDTKYSDKLDKIQKAWDDKNLKKK